MEATTKRWAWAIVAYVLLIFAYTMVALAADQRGADFCFHEPSPRVSSSASAQ